MQQRQLGPFNVSAIGLGCMNVSAGYGPRIADDEAGELFNAALDAGYSFLDTASLYGFGHNESLIGKDLAHHRDEYVLASKCGFSWTGDGENRTFDGRPEVLAQTCENSLKRLNTEVIDIYYLHRIDPKRIRDDLGGTCFRYEGEISVLRNPGDPLDQPMFAPGIRGRTDRVVYKFRRV